MTQTHTPRAGFAIFGMTLCVMTLIACEFMPLSLLTPMARDLGITEGQAGQTISISGIFAMVTSLTWQRAVRGLDRRILMSAMGGLLALSGVLVSAAPGAGVLILGRALLGIAIGVYWSLCTAVVLRLLPPERVAGGVALISAGTALASTIAAPLGAIGGEVLGWRLTFLAVVPLGLLAMVWQALTLPSLPAEPKPSVSLGQLVGDPLIRRGQVVLGVFFVGNFLLFTYLRPFLEQITQAQPNQMAGLFLVLGLAGFAGNLLIRFSGRIGTAGLLKAIPLGMALVALGLALAGPWIVVTGGLLAVWGFLSTPLPAIWGASLARARPDWAESVGGLSVAVIQLAIMSGAFVGGAVLDLAGPLSLSFGAAFTLGLAALATGRATRQLP